MKGEKNYKDLYTSYFLGKIIELVRENYFLDISDETLYRAAMEGIINSLDPYSVYLLPEKKEINNKIKIPVEKYKFNNCIDVIRINVINEEAVKLLEQIVDCLIYQEKTDKVIIDLRNNIGGITDSLFKMCELFFSEKEVFKRVRKNKTIKCVTKKLSNTFEKIIVLVNEKTMSSAEIMAAAFQDNGTVIIGKRTYGKGLAQKSYKTFDGGYILITTEEYLRTNGDKIQGKGITPDIIIEDENKILETAYKILEEKSCEKEY